MNYRDPEIYQHFKRIEDDVSTLSNEDLLLTLEKCEEMLELEIPERYYDDAHAYIYFINERLKLGGIQR
jgi:hypothetical protein